jgi:2-dehydro-3-deoxyglucarate aldolase/4-hydroxy-2-oxoheptanedioate aldolase
VRKNPVKRMLEEGRLPVGVMLYEFATTGAVRILDAAGADFAIFDLEHTGWSSETIRSVTATARGSRLWPVVRVPRAIYHLVAGTLDAGALGVMAPMVETEEEARALVAAAKYPPAGRRGFGAVYPDQLDDGPAAWMKSSNRETLVIAQIESASGIESVDGIAAVPGIDLLWLGHYDLTSSLGIPGEFDHPRFLEAVERLVEAGRRNGRPVGIMVTNPDQVTTWLERGFGCIAFGDVWVFEQAVRASVEGVRAAIR